MNGKIFGIPLVIIILAFSIATLVDLPLFCFNVVTQNRLSRLERMVGEVNLTVKTPTVTPTETPTPSPSLKGYQPASKSAFTK